MTGTEPDLWKIRTNDGWRYFEVDQRAALEAALTEEAIRFGFNSRPSYERRQRFRAWLLRNTDGSHEAENQVGLSRPGMMPPRLYGLFDGEWVRVDWDLIEPTVVIRAVPGDDA